jgi:hypothetical protein
MPRSQLSKRKTKTLSKTKSIGRKTKTKPIKSKTTGKTKTKTIRKTTSKTKTKTTGKSKRKSLINSQYKTIEYPDYQDKSELVGTDLRNKVIHGAYMKNMNLSHAKLHGTKFVDCTFIHVNFDHAFVDKGTEFINCKFKGCKTDNIKYVNGARQAEFDNVFNSSDA